MTTEQIKAIAEEYAEHKSPMANFINAYDKRDNFNEAYKKEAEDVLTFLSDRYCIVEREKVMELYRDCKKLMDVYPSMSNGLANKLTTMEQLFGTSMFNQNEE